MLTPYKLLLYLFRDNRYACYVPKPLIVEFFVNWQEIGRPFMSPIGDKKSSPKDKKMRYSFEAHLMNFGPVDAFWWLPSALTNLVTKTSALG